MNVFGLEISWRRKPKPVGAKRGEPKTFLLAVRKYGDYPAHKVAYSHSPLSGDTPIFVKKVPMEDSLQVAEDIEKFIEDRWGGGEWKLQILDSDNLAIATYQKTVPGPLYSTRTGKKREPGDPGRDGYGSGGSRRGGLAEQIENLSSLATVIKTMQGDGGASRMEGLFEQVVVSQFNNNLSREESRMQDVKSIIEIGQLFAPKVAAEDPLTGLLSSLAPPVVSALMMRGAGNPALAGGQVSALPVGGNDGHDMNALRNAASRLPPAVIGSLPPQEQAAVIRLRDSAPSYGQGSAVLPRPGTPTPGAELPPQPGGGAGPVGNAAAPSPSPYHGAIDDMIVDIRRDLASGAPDSKVGGKLMALMDFARRFTAERPHPMLAGMMSAPDDERGNQEFGRLCTEVLGLQRNPARIASLGDAILTLMEAGAKETMESIKDAPSEEAEPDTGDHPGPEFDFETEADRDAAVREGVTDGDVPQPAGVRGPGEVEDSEDSQQIRETA